MLRMNAFSPRETQYFASPLWFATDYIAGNVETSRRSIEEKGGRLTNRHMFIISVLMTYWDENRPQHHKNVMAECGLNTS